MPTHLPINHRINPSLLEDFTKAVTEGTVLEVEPNTYLSISQQTVTS